jgi:hypothetical protein
MKPPPAGGAARGNDNRRMEMTLELTDKRETELIAISEDLVEFLKSLNLDPVEATGVLLVAVTMVHHESGSDLDIEQLGDRIRNVLLDADAKCAKLDVSH